MLRDMVGREGIEPSASGMSNQCSATELTTCAPEPAVQEGWLVGRDSNPLIGLRALSGNSGVHDLSCCLPMCGGAGRSRTVVAGFSVQCSAAERPPQNIRAVGARFVFVLNMQLSKTKKPGLVRAGFLEFACYGCALGPAPGVRNVLGLGTESAVRGDDTIPPDHAIHRVGCLFGSECGGDQSHDGGIIDQVIGICKVPVSGNRATVALARPAHQRRSIPA